MKKSYWILISILLLTIFGGIIGFLFIKYNPTTFVIFSSEGVVIKQNNYYLKSDFQGDWVEMARLNLMNGNYLIFREGYDIRLQGEKLVILNNFKGLLKIDPKNQLSILGQIFSFESDGTLLVDTNTKSIWMIEGKAMSGDIGLQTGDKFQFDNKIGINKFDRKELLENFQNFIDDGIKAEQIPESLRDFEAPSLGVLVDSNNVTDETANIKIVCTNCTVLFLNDLNLSEYILDGQAVLEQTLTLEIGENNYVVYATDEWGNKAEETLDIERTDICEGNTKCGECGNPACPSPTPKSPQPTVTNKPSTTPILTPKPTSVPAGSCASGGFNSSFLTLLNNYRQSQGLNTLSIEVKLTNAAYSHSYWMANGGSFSHTGANGSTPWDRCKNAGTSCDAENIAYGSSDANTVFDMWKNSPGHNANMLGSHSVVGICVVGGYSTLVLR